jgi:hypothetical protein
VFISPLPSSAFELAPKVNSEITQEKVFNQCDSASPFKAEIQFSNSSTQTNQQELELTGSAGTEAGVSTIARVTLEGEIERHFTSSSTSGQGHEEKALIEVPPHSHQKYYIIWRESRREGTVQYIENGQTKTASFSYRIGLELGSTAVIDLICPGQLPGENIATLSPTESTANIPIQETQIIEATNTTAPTAIPTPSLALPFEDNFDNSLRPEWTIIGGQPLFINGHLTALSDELLTLLIGDASFGGNFTVSLDTPKCTYPHGPLIITIGQKTRFKLEGVAASVRFAWEEFQDNEWITRENTGGPPCEVSVQISVAGNAYTVLIQGEVYREFAYGEPVFGPLTLSIGQQREIDNVRITSP